MSREEVNIQDYVSILRKRRWVFLSSFLIVFVTVAAATFLATPVYRASALVYIDPGNNPQVSFLPTQNLTDNPAYLQTQIGILKSDTIAKKVVVRLNLDQRYKDAAGSVFTPAGLLSFIGLRPDSGSVDALNGKVVKRFLDNLEVTAVKGSNLLNVTYEDESAQLAAQVVNTTVQTFIEQSLEMKVAPAREAMSWLNDKLGEIKGRMTESSSQLQDFKQERGLLVTGDKQTNISIQSLSEFNDRVMAAEARRLEAEVKYQQVVKLSRTPTGL